MIRHSTTSCLDLQQNLLVQSVESQSLHQHSQLASDRHSLSCILQNMQRNLLRRWNVSGAKAYLVNTGWNGTGKRISIKDTRGIIDAILNGAINNAPTKTIPYFNFEVPTELEGVDTGILDPRDTYADASEWDVKAKDLAERFIKNFAKYEGNEAGKALVAAGPQL